MKLVVNKCHGGFGLSPIAIAEYLKLKGKECFFYKKNYNDKLYHKSEVEKLNIPAVSGLVCLHEWDEGFHNVSKCKKCGKYSA